MEAWDLNTVDAYDAKTRFSELLERVARGAEITITRNGSSVARLVPVRAASTAESRREAIRMMRQLASHKRLGRLRVKDLIAEGRE